MTLTSFTADRSELWKIPLVRMCQIDEGRGMQGWVAIFSLFLLSEEKWRGHFVPAPIGARFKHAAENLDSVPREHLCQQ